MRDTPFFNLSHNPDIPHPEDAYLLGDSLVTSFESLEIDFENSGIPCQTGAAPKRQLREKRIKSLNHLAIAMALSLGSLLWALILLVNSVAVLNEERFLSQSNHGPRLASNTL